MSNIESTTQVLLGIKNLIDTRPLGLDLKYVTATETATKIMSVESRGEDTITVKCRSTLPYGVDHTETFQVLYLSKAEKGGPFALLLRTDGQIFTVAL